MTSRALSLLAAFASLVFTAGAIAGWLSGLVPATPVTFALAASLVIGGPVLGIVHAATADEGDEVLAPAVAPAPPPVAQAPPLAVAPAPPPVAQAPVAAATPLPPTVELTPRAAAARRFAAWRDAPNAAITQRERERRASQHLSAARRHVPAGG